MKNTDTYLPKREIIIGETTGERVISEQKKEFFFIDPNFEKFGLDKESKPTKECKVLFYEIKKTKPLKQLFEDFGTDLKKNCFTQDQILQVVESCEKDPESECFGKLFLTKKLKMIALLPLIFFVNLFMKKKIKYYKYFVIDIFSYMTGLRSEVYSIDDKSVSWGGGSFPCVAIPVIQFKNEYLNVLSSRIIKIDETKFVCQKLKKNGTFRQIFEGFNIPFRKIFVTEKEIYSIVSEGAKTEKYKRMFFLTRKMRFILWFPFIFILNLFLWKKRLSYYRYFPVSCHSKMLRFCLEELVFDHDSGWSTNFETEVFIREK